MTWHVQYHAASGDAVELFLTAEGAIEAACELIESGHDVYGLGTGPLTDSISKPEIDKIYVIWSRGHETCRKPPPDSAKSN